MKGHHLLCDPKNLFINGKFLCAAAAALSVPSLHIAFIPLKIDLALALVVMY